MKKTKIGTLDDLKPHKQFSKWIDGHDVLVFEHNGKVRAFSNICPHFGGPVGYHEVKRNKINKFVFTCLWHNLEFDVENGMCIQRKNLKLREYDLVIEDNSIMIYLN